MNKLLFPLFLVVAIALFFNKDKYATKASKEFEHLELLLQSLPKIQDNTDSIFLCCNNASLGLPLKVQFILAPTRMISLSENSTNASGILLTVQDNKEKLELPASWQHKADTLYAHQDSFFTIHLLQYN